MTFVFFEMCSGAFKKVPAVREKRKYRKKHLKNSVFSRDNIRDAQKIWVRKNPKISKISVLAPGAGWGGLQTGLYTFAHGSLGLTAPWDPGHGLSWNLSKVGKVGKVGNLTKVTGGGGGCPRGGGEFCCFVIKYL